MWRHSAPKRGWLTRHGFSEGAPSYFYLQAVELMTAVECLPRLDSVGRFPKADVGREMASVRMEEFLEPVTEDPEFLERETMRRLGTTMSSGVLSAFACELALKAICLTVTGEAKKSHDLVVLYGGLPRGSRDRITADLSDMDEIIEESRHLFWQLAVFRAASWGVGDAGTNRCPASESSGQRRKGASGRGRHGGTRVRCGDECDQKDAERGR